VGPRVLFEVEGLDLWEGDRKQFNIIFHCSLNCLPGTRTRSGNTSMGSRHGSSRSCTTHKPWPRSALSTTSSRVLGGRSISSSPGITLKCRILLARLVVSVMWNSVLSPSFPRNISFSKAPTRVVHEENELQVTILPTL